jgi:hypothetical protein
VFVVGEVFGEPVAVFRAEELVEDVDGGGAEEGFVVVAAVFVEGAGGAAVGLAAVAVAELVAGAFGEGFEVLVDGAGGAEDAGVAVRKLFSWSVD